MSEDLRYKRTEKHIREEIFLLSTIYVIMKEGTIYNLLQV